MTVQLPANMQNKISVELAPVVIDDFCWTWTGCKNSRGYGCVQFNGKVQLAHRVAYEVTHGVIPDGLQIDHLCVNELCCNPAHLQAVTGKTNVERSYTANKTMCTNGHPYTPENTIWRKRGHLRHRDCRECNNRRNREYYARKATA